MPTIAAKWLCTKRASPTTLWLVCVAGCFLLWTLWVEVNGVADAVFPILVPALTNNVYSRCRKWSWGLHCVVLYLQHTFILQRRLPSVLNDLIQRTKDSVRELDNLTKEHHSEVSIYSYWNPALLACYFYTQVYLKFRTKYYLKCHMLSSWLSGWNGIKL